MEKQTTQAKKVSSLKGVAVSERWGWTLIDVLYHNEQQLVQS